MSVKRARRGPSVDLLTKLGEAARELEYHNRLGKPLDTGVALWTKLAEAFPYHRDWIKWYAAVARYSEYQKAGARK